MNLTDTEKRQMTERAFSRIVAVYFPLPYENPQEIVFLFGDENTLLDAMYPYKNFNRVGLSMIIEKINQKTVTIKLFDVDSDDFFVIKNVHSGEMGFDEFKITHEKDTFLSFGITKKINDSYQKFVDNPLRLPLVSIQFLDQISSEDFLPTT